MENNNITVSDLESIRKLIDVACTRGAFNAAEVKAVGELYEKLCNFLEAVVARAQTQEENTATKPNNPQGE